MPNVHHGNDAGRLESVTYVLNVVSYGYETGSNLIETRTVKVNGSRVMQT